MAEILTEKRRRGLLSHIQLIEYTARQLPNKIIGKRAKGPAATLAKQLHDVCTIAKELLRYHVAIDADEAPAVKERPAKVVRRATRGMRARSKQYID